MQIQINNWNIVRTLIPFISKIEIWKRKFFVLLKLFILILSNLSINLYLPEINPKIYSLTFFTIFTYQRPIIYIFFKKSPDPTKHKYFNNFDFEELESPDYRGPFIHKPDQDPYKSNFQATKDKKYTFPALKGPKKKQIGAEFEGFNFCSEVYSKYS